MQFSCGGYMHSNLIVKRKSLSTSTVISTPNLRNLTPGSGNFLKSVLTANAAPTLISALYVVYNTALTTLLLAREWDQYASQRKGLRVTSVPKGAQRSTYFL